MRSRGSSKFSGWALVITAAAMWLSLGACSSLVGKADVEAPVAYSKELGPTPEKALPDANLRKTFARYWGLRFAGDVEKAFAIEAPYFQEMVGVTRYRLFVQGTRKNKLIEMEIRGVEHKTEHFYEIQCQSRFKMPQGEIKELYLVDRWVNVDGAWFHVLKDSVVFPAAS